MIDAVIQRDSNIQKMPRLKEELEKMWGVKVTVVSVVMGALGALGAKTHILGEWLQQIPGTSVCE